ncbi:MAG: alanine--glyoxylate aminotransferase family protein [Candidatus Abyssobacteria bacterium SURF_17]|uniref:Alanine--glyoxylate aminotransferase family protein n=1 Tax=Candidatus Abyssobacteria bacterium SURF_17 TaxID=2093361 RepID=A0A419EVW8_9BACT|nr:MAG: alanine--glyoxylate aminotransferase family protein [Candidatus Abyssubacteria bacterium SURF_17]
MKESDRSVFEELTPSLRILMGPGPSNVHPRVLRAMSTPLVGHLDPDFLRIMSEVQALLRQLFKTDNPMTIPMSGTGSAGMETCFCNLLERGDRVLVCVNGLFGERMCDVAGRLGADVSRVEMEWGKPIEPKTVENALKAGKVKIVAIVHAETSTGVRQPLEEISRIAKEHGALFLVDTVTSLAGCNVDVDAWDIDACYSGTQKCLSCPPGLSPVTFSDKAMNALRSRKHKVSSWYLDLSMIERYWGEERFYHHTAPISMIYALREALRLIMEEGLEARFERHRLNHLALAAGLAALEIDFLVDEPYRLPMLNAVKIPDGVNDLNVRKYLLQKFGIELGGGLGPLKGKIWRIGLMGHSSTKQNVVLFLTALNSAVAAEGMKVAPGAAAAAAMEAYSQHDR